MAWQNSSEGYSADWVLSNNSNVHVCNDKKWFREYTPFSSTASTFLGSDHISVEGVGSVDLPVKRAPNLSGPKAHHHLHLTNVLYIPSSTCNLIGSPIFKSVPQIEFGATPKSSGSMKDADGRPVAYFSPLQKRRLPCLKISGPPVGPRLAPSRFKPDQHYILRITWPDSERKRWETHLREAEADDKRSQWIGDQPYTPDEKAWLKKNYGGEFKFLQMYGLSIYKEVDRSDGRAMMRALRGMDIDRDDEEKDEDMDNDGNGNDDDGEDGDDDFDSWNPDNHLADHHFSAKELRWIKKYYQDSATFMFAFGLKFYNDEDCADAKNLVRSFLSG